MMTPINFGGRIIKAAVNRLIEGANSRRVIVGYGLTFQQTPRGIIISRIRNEIPPAPIIPSMPPIWYFDMPLSGTFAGNSSVEVASGSPSPGPDTGNPLAYGAFAPPVGSYQIQFLDQSFNPINAPSPGSISAAGPSISNLTTTTVPDPFRSPPGTIYFYNWVATFTFSPLQTIAGNVQQGRFFFSNGIPTNATYALIGSPGNTAQTGKNGFQYQQPNNIGQFVIKQYLPNFSGGV